MQLDPVQIAVPGSRWPIALSRARLNGGASPTPPLPFLSLPGAFKVERPAPAVPSSISRRKPKITFRSPDADAPHRMTWPARTPFVLSSVVQQTTLAVKSNETLSTPSVSAAVAANATASSSRGWSPVFKPAPPIFRMPPPLPVYHPLGPRMVASLPNALNQSLPKTKGKATASLGDENDSRRSSSRTRKPAAKVREAGDQDGDDDVYALPAPSATATAAVGAKTAASPQKRKRASGTSGSSRKRRKDVSTTERDGTYPNRRSRPVRNTVAQSGSGNDGAEMEVAASPADSNAPGSDGGVEEKEQEAEAISNANSNTKRATRTRRPRVASVSTMKRRSSSASEATATSVSISIAGALANGGKAGAPETPRE